MKPTSLNSDLEPLPHPPIVPDELAKLHDVQIATDNRFKAASRLLASLWRSDKGLAAGSYVDDVGRRHRVGSLLTQADGRLGHNFLSPAVARLAMHELYNREPGSAWDADRLRRNLLSSQTLCLNLVGPLRLDLDLATAVISELVPDFIADVVDVLFEHSPRRGHPALTNDYTALDVLIRAKTIDGKRAIIGMEMKFTEDCHERVPRIDKRHGEIAAASGAFMDPTDPDLRESPLQQLYRLQNLTQSMLDNDLADEAVLLFVAPAMNEPAHAAARRFAEKLAPPAGKTVRFMTTTVERVIELIATVGQPNYAETLFRRYCDLHQVAGEIDLHADEVLATGPTAASTTLLPPPAEAS